jgi:hypothetical protein
MRIISTIIFLFFFELVYAQEVDHVKLVKEEVEVFQGVLKETENWYVFRDTNNYYYLSNLNSSVEDVYAWFSRFKDSQNIYKQLNLLEALGQKELVFYKENQPEDRLSFYLNLSELDVVILTLISDGEVFRFEKIDP